MINNLKLGLKIMGYGYGIRMCLIQGALFVLAGILFFTIGADVPGAPFNRSLPGDLMLMSTGMLPAQVLYSLSAVNMVQASPMKKKLQTTVPVAITWTCMTVLYLAIVLIRGILVLNHPEKLSGVCNGLIMLGAVMALFMLYIGVAYKYFFSILFFLIPIVYLELYKIPRLVAQSNVLWQNENVFSFVVAAAIGLVCIAAGGMGQYLLSLLVYRAPMSKMAQMAPLRKEL